MFSKEPNHSIRICWLKTGADCDLDTIFDAQIKQSKGLVLRRLQYFAEHRRFQNSDAGSFIEGMAEVRGHPHDFRGFLSKHSSKDVWVLNSAVQKKRGKFKRTDIARALERAEMAKDLSLPQ